MHPEHLPISLVQPSHENEPISRADPLKRIFDGRLQEDQRVGRSFAALARGVGPISEGRADDAYRLQHVPVVRHGARYIRCATRIWLPEGSRKPASTPYGCSVGSCVNSTPRPFSSS